MTEQSGVKRSSEPTTNNVEPTTLLPCPFCGGKARLQDFDHFNTRSGKYVHEWAFWHHCPPMGKHRNVYGQGTGAMVIESAYFETREDAIAAWNRRAES